MMMVLTEKLGNDIRMSVLAMIIDGILRRNDIMCSAIKNRFIKEISK